MVDKIKKILYSNLSPEDKIIEMTQLLPRINTEAVTVFGSECEVRREGNAVIYDGSMRNSIEYVDNPVLKNPDDIYYSGCGTTWGKDDNGDRYWKRYNKFGKRFSDKEQYPHLNHGDIIDEEARIKKYFKKFMEIL